MGLRVINGLEDLQSLVDQRLGVSDWLEVTQDRINAFAESTGDRQWIHVDPERAKVESPYGCTIAHGFLTLSLSITLAESAFRIDGVRMIVNYGLNRVRFPSPVRVGSRIRSVTDLLEVKPAADGVQAVFKHTIEVEGADKPASVIESVLRLFF